MDLQTRKISFVQEFLKLQNEEIIVLFEKLLKKEQIKNDDKRFQPMNQDDFNLRIDKSLVDSERDQVLNTADLISDIEKWD